jgi:sugar phosphate isomerase/epimerase
VSEVCSGPIPFVEEVQFWKELGANDIGMISPKLEPIKWDTALVAETGLRVSNVGTEERFVADAVDFAAAMGADSVWLEPGGIGSRTWEEAADDFCKRIAPSVGRANELGIPFAVQPTNALRLDLSFIFTLRDSLELARTAGTGVVLELQCCWYEPGWKSWCAKTSTR